VILLEKAIYGMAMPFNDSYWEFDHEQETFVFDKTNRDAVVIDGLVGATVDHDFSRTIGVTGENLFLQAHERGVFFKLIPDSPFGQSIYKKVKRGELRYCSCMYFVRSARRDYQAEDEAMTLARSFGIQEKVVVREYRRIILFEICLTNNPANKTTFCTTDENHPLLQGVTWENSFDGKPRMKLENRQPFRPLHIEKIEREISEIERELKALEERIEQL
jgi:phage head maturation protease